MVWLGLTACVGASDPGTAKTCSQTYSAAQGWGFEEDPIWWGRDPQAVERDCDLFGDPCAAEDFLTRAAAQCIAEGQGFAPGLQDWRYDLGYEESLSTVRWRIETVTEIGDTSSKGDFLSIDAQTGEVVDAGSWTDEAI
jgi:hypothetical protein